MPDFRARPVGLLAAFLIAIAKLAVVSAQAQELKIYSATDTSAMQSVLDDFGDRFPEVEVVYKEYNTLELYNAILKGGITDADVVISSSMDLQVDLVNRGLAQPVAVAQSRTMPEWAQWRSELFGFTYEPAVVIYNKKAFENRELPATRSALASAIRDDPQFFKNAIGSYDIAVSGVGYLFATQDLQRSYQFWRLVESFGRAGLQVFCCTYEILNRVADGELVFGYNVIGSYAAEKARIDPRLGVYALSDYTLVMSRSAFVHKAAPNPEHAKRFVNYLLSREGQQRIADHSGLISILEAADPQNGRLKETLGGIKTPQPVKIGPGLIGYLDTVKRAQVLEDWRAALGPGGD